MQNNWEGHFCEYYGSRISNVENILELFREGMRMVDDDSNWSEFCSKLVKTGMLYDSRDPELGHDLVYFSCKNRNLSLFLYYWCPEFAIFSLNCMLLQGKTDLLNIMYAMPHEDKKFSNYVTNSPLLETALSKFLEYEQRECLMVIAVIIMAIGMHRELSENLSLTSTKKTLIRKVNKKINKLLKKRSSLFSYERGCFNNLKNFLKLVLQGKKSYPQVENWSEKTKKVWRTDHKSICRNKSCSKSMISGAKYCSRCCYTSYCSVECQTMDWPIHRKKCKPMYCKVGKLLSPFFECGVLEKLQNIS
jgi:hypothetical protein